MRWLSTRSGALSSTAAPGRKPSDDAVRRYETSWRRSNFCQLHRRRPMDRLLRVLLQKLIRTGNLRITTARGSTFTCGDKIGTPVAIRFITRAAQRGVLVDPELRLGEAYMDGGVVLERGSIADLLAVVLGQPSPPRWVRPLRLTRYLHRHSMRFNSRRRARSNVARHYDLDSRLYALFLDFDLQYSCAYFEIGRPIARRCPARQETPSRGQAPDRARPAGARHRLRLGRPCALPRGTLRHSRHRYYAVGEATRDRARSRGRDRIDEQDPSSACRTIATRRENSIASSRSACSSMSDPGSTIRSSGNARRSSMTTG